MVFRTLKIVLLSIILLSVLKQEGFSQSHEALIYGEITTISKATYRGQIRWSKSYVHWNDILWAYKEKNTIKQILSSDEIEQLNIKSKSDFSFDFLNLWDPSFIESESSFKCNFGFLKSIQVIGSENARVELKNGYKIELYGENIGDDIYIYDEVKGKIKLEWREIDKIKFSKTPEKLKNFHGLPLYAEINTKHGKIEGNIIWNYECCETDFIDWEYRDKHKRWLYKDISHIQREDKYFHVYLKDGKKDKLCCENDLNAHRLDLLIKNDEFGWLKIRAWEMYEVIFKPLPTNYMRYDDYLGPNRLKAKITTTENKTYTGEIIYDLDELFTSDILDGMKDGFYYRIPFHLIKTIRPINYIYTEITLSNDKTLTLTGTSDVSEDNNGMLIKLPRNKYSYLKWNTIKEINFTNE